MNREVGLDSLSLSHSPPVPNKPDGVCGRKAPSKKRKKKKNVRWLTLVFVRPEVTLCGWQYVKVRYLTRLHGFIKITVDK